MKHNIEIDERMRKKPKRYVGNAIKLIFLLGQKNIKIEAIKIMRSSLICSCESWTLNKFGINVMDLK